MSTGKFIVVFKDNVSKADIDQYVSELNTSGGEVTNSYYSEGGILNGFAAKIPESFLTSRLQGNEVVDYIEPDGVVTTQ
ncbi:hypothetical protein CC1G_06934 [Coprinopsis cinerea okayama7|uniref:Inhibitor I9 domain-containing protein n=1 Tax=Coprinopsis cinerea (strain Okayama-7 / 130 / ATCC MYA-4618 / FGSC 9003) TaxID=240176 RepID=A8NZR1_COPC7|nr:hypothetical protein CC1G_06934 [Coprinopsis cinerea okayama7\|eukprot:XP_001837728.1 hypothetical protein CC1G_06934 [Coprinopsis cinerea okayama7\